MRPRIADIMATPAITTRPHKSVGHAKSIMKKNHIQSIPVVDTEGKVKGIVTPSDLLGVDDGTPVSKVMTKKVHCIPQYSKISEAARCMRNHRIHHLVVTHEKRVVGVLSSYDLLKLVEEHRFVMK